jgi:hypothetical protein
MMDAHPGSTERETDPTAELNFQEAKPVQQEIFSYLN